jgi:POT family proton-dependent oligopeptide transporter
MTAGVNHAMVRPIHAESAEVGARTWVQLDDVSSFVVGQKIDFAGKNGVEVVKADGKTQPLSGTYLVAGTDPAGKRLELMDVVDRKPLSSRGTFDAGKAEVSTYRLVGPQYFNFFALVMACVGLLFVVVAYFYKEKTHLRDESAGAG